MTQSPFRLQLAVQGGGAKIAALVAAMAAVEELESAGKITVTRLAGTSAGSVVCALFAARVPMATVRAKLLAVAPSLIKEYTLPSMWRAVLKIVLGRSIWSQASIGKVVRDFLAQTPGGEGVELGQLTPPVLVAATDLLNHRLKKLEKSAPAVHSVLCSTAIPFAFRSHRDDWDVDGGICENLPSTLLMSEVANSGPVLGLSFRAEYVDSQRRRSLREYCASLLLTAMNNSVIRAKEQLGGSCIQLVSARAFSSDQELTTFGFDLAHRFLADDERFDALKERTKRDVLDWIERTQAARQQTKELTDRSWSSTDTTNVAAVRLREIQRQLAAAYRAQHASQPIVYDRVDLYVIARSLDQNLEKKSDMFWMRTVISTNDRTCYCHKIGLVQAEHNSLVVDAEVEVTGPNGEKLADVVYVPIEDESDPRTREVLLFLVPALTPKNGPYTISYTTDAVGILEPLKANGEDELYLESFRVSESGFRQVSIVVAIPAKFGEVLLSSDHGKAMNDEALQSVIAAAGPIPAGYYIQGMAAENIPRGERFTVQLRRT